MKNTDYHRYRPGRKELLSETAVFLLLDGACAWLFYNSVIACVFLLPLLALWIRILNRMAAAKRRRRLAADFRDALNMMSVSLRAGRAAEQAIQEAASELAVMKGEDADITREFRYIARQLTLSVPAEKLLLDFAGRSGVEEIEDFAAVFSAAKRTGGNMAAIIRKAAESIEGRIDVEMEIETTISAKKMEHRIMSLMPAGIIAYMRVTSPGFLDDLYGSVFGAGVMTAALAVYALSVWWGGKIVQIEV